MSQRRDRGEKLEQYKSIESLQAVRLFSQISRRVELHERSEHGFRREAVTGDQRIELACIGVDLALSSIYADAGL